MNFCENIEQGTHVKPSSLGVGVEVETPSLEGIGWVFLAHKASTSHDEKLKKKKSRPINVWRVVHWRPFIARFIIANIL